MTERVERIRHVLGAPWIKQIRLCRLTHRQALDGVCPVHKNTACLDTYIHYDETVSEIDKALRERRL